MDPAQNASLINPDSLPPVSDNAIPADAPEGIQSLVVPKPSSVQYAGLEKRFIAALIDSAILFAFNWAIGFTIQLVINFMIRSFLESGFIFAIIGVYLSFLMGLVIGIGYFVFYQFKTGQTIGKKMQGIKVVDIQTGQTPTKGKLFLREIIFKMASGLLLGFGFVILFFDPKRQALHDKLAGTIVVNV